MVRTFDFDKIVSGFSGRIQDPESQRRMVLCVVCVALLLDNMLYMVIVPIIPDYLQTMSGLGHEEVLWINATHSKRISMLSDNFTATSGQYQLRWLVHESDTKIGTLFAFKAIVQLLFNPVSGTIIDRIGYDLPMMFGLCVIFVSTSMFAFGSSYGVLFLARGLQGVGSAFADTAGLAMIADRYTVEAERTKALGIALAFISFGSLVAPPFGGILYQFFGKELPFISLAFVALFDGFLLMIIMQPVRIERTVLKAEGNLPKGTPIHRLLLDPYIAICAGCLTIANVSLAFLEPTISNWMSETMHATNAQEGLVWLPAFLPHLAGVITTVKLAAKYPKFQWLMAAVGLAIEGMSCFLIPFCTNFLALMIPISILCYGIALVDTAILPTMGFLVDTRHVSVYGSVYAIADLSYSVAYALGPIVAGELVQAIKFLGLNIVMTLVTLIYVPVLYLLRGCYLENEITAASRDLRRRSTFSADSKRYSVSATTDALGITEGTDQPIYPGYEQQELEDRTTKHMHPQKTVTFGRSSHDSYEGYNDMPDEFNAKHDGYGYG
ncbi:hypothetical protein CRM22_001267 [Opisthorchis felineus]|uniref:Major facilitator superfamily (MFS) profile domain-containing protein n=1 Tax=Opisthorchis felineus TaxID=147828 RepID=A0A4S2MFN4_OPIFE|nr:hypothetical protein CRM22_001267 [Opisthorchis felineus]